MSEYQTVVTQLTLTPAMHAAVLDSLGADPATFDAGDPDDRRGLVEAGLAELDEASLLARDGDVTVIHPLLQEIVLATLDPEVVIRCVMARPDEGSRATSIFSRSLGPVSYAGPHPETGVRSYRIYDLWEDALGSVIDWLELPDVDAESGESAVPTEQAVAWLSGADGAEPPGELAGLGKTLAIGNVAVVRAAEGVAKDGRNIAMVATDAGFWFVEPDDNDPAVSTVHPGDAETLADWLGTALAATAAPEE